MKPRVAPPVPAPSDEQETRLREAKAQIATLVHCQTERRRRFVAHVASKLQRINAPVVLVVEDDERLAVWFAEVVEHMRATPRVCGNGLQALAIAQAEPIDFFLIDLNLPGIDGIELAERIRASSRLPLSPILFVSGEIPRETLERIATLAGANGYIHKPVSEADLQREVQRLLPMSSTGP
jgi:CheY-like chemotaxis protein